MKTRALWLALTVVLAGFAAGHAQVYNPVKWKFDYKLDGDEHAVLRFSASIEKGWHVYSSKISEDIGPIPTAFDFQKLEGATLAGDLKEPKAHVAFDPNFNVEIAWFEGSAVFEQRVKLTSARATVQGELTYMTCDDKKCLPPDYIPFSFDIEAALKPSTGSATVSDAKPSETIPNEEPANEGVLTPVKWTFDAVDRGGGLYTLRAHATMDKGWHVYSLDLVEGDGPVPTELRLLSGPFELMGATREVGEKHTEYDPNFMLDLNFFESEFTLEQDFKLSGEGEVVGEVYFMCCNAEMCLPPDNPTFMLNAAEGKVSWVGGEAPIVAAGDESGEVIETTDDSDQLDGGFWTLLLLGFGGGLLALLTPCVFPMIPLTVSFFTKQSKTKAQGIRNGTIYGLSVIILYTGLGVLITTIFGKDALHALSTNTYFNLFLFALLVVFAISFFGAFEITLPASLANKLDRASEKQGLVGIFFMASTLTVVSFSCTGPIIGSVIGIGGVSQLATTMFGFSLALGLPFALFAMFPGWLNSLPRSGGWLNSVKVCLGFVELAFAFKFLSNADLVEQWHLLERELFIAIWIVCFGLLGVYLLGGFQMPHDSKLERISVGRAMFATAALVFTLYLIPGLWGAPLKLISGFPPPDFYAEHPYGLYQSAQPQAAGTGSSEPKHDGGHCPKNLNCFHDYDEAMAYAKEVGKPLMLDFTGWACVNCRKMEEEVWSDPEVWRRLNDEVVLASLYVDENAELPESEWFESAVLGKTVKRVGQKWVDFEISRFGQNSQPLYVLLDHNEKQLNKPTAYDPDVPLFIAWLDEGISAFHNSK